MNTKICCRSCMHEMHEREVVDWHEELFELSGMTYKECYYKYTDLKEHVPDPFPQSLCSDCSRNLQNFHLWLEKAIETQRLLEQNLKSTSLSFNGGIADDLTITCNVECVYDEGDSFSGEMTEATNLNKSMPSDNDLADCHHIKRPQRKRKDQRSIDLRCVTKDTIIETEYVNITNQNLAFIEVQARRPTKLSLPQRTQDRNCKNVNNITEDSKIICNIKEECLDVDIKDNQNEIQRTRGSSDQVLQKLDTTEHSEIPVNIETECVYFHENSEYSLEMVEELEHSKTKKRKAATAVPSEVLEQNMDILDILVNNEPESIIRKPKLREIKPETEKTKHRKKKYSVTLDLQYNDNRRKSKDRKIFQKAKVNDEKNLDTTTGVPTSEELKTNNRKRISLCSICSKILNSRTALQKHELAHQKDRERHLICSKCGFKTYDNTVLKHHLEIHDTNREKKYKCEFCDKAFFNRGACNVHRRIHLGQMIKCPLCPKECFRQVDVDRHMATHSLAPVSTSKSSTRNVYLVHCKDCGKKIRSDNFRAHQENHIKIPYAKCTICDKDFFSRVRCTQHMRRIHDRIAGQYEDIAFFYIQENARPRTSHILLKQQEYLIERIE